MTEPLYRVIVEGFKGIFAVLGMKLDIVGEENIPLQGGAVLALNHTSYLDFALGGVPADRRGRRFVRFMAKDSVFRHPIAGPLMRGMKHIPVDRHDGSVAFETAVAAARAGELIGVFPEATMSRSLEIKELKNGAVRMAREAEVPLIPMIVFGGHRVLSYDVRDFTRGRTICMTIGRPISTNDDVDEMTDALRSTLSELLDETITDTRTSSRGRLGSRSDMVVRRRHSRKPLVSKSGAERHGSQSNCRPCELEKG